MAQLRDDFIHKFGLHVSCIVLAVRFVIYIHVNANCLDLQARPNLNLSNNVRSKKITGVGSKQSKHLNTSMITSNISKRWNRK